MHEVPHEVRQAGGTWPIFRIPGSVPCGGHWPFSDTQPFLSVFPALSSELSYLQVERGHPSWQYPHGTKSHDPQPTPLLGAGVGSADGALDALGMLLGDADGSDDGGSVGSGDGALLDCAVGEELEPPFGVGALLGSVDGAHSVMQGSPIP